MIAQKASEILRLLFVMVVLASMAAVTPSSQLTSIGEWIAKKWHASRQVYPIVNISFVILDEYLQMPELAPRMHVLQRVEIQTMPPTPTPKEDSVEYIVQSGDTLNAIAYQFGVSVFDIMEANHIENINYIMKGQKLIIPRRSNEYIIPVSPDEIDLLNRLVEAEAGGEPYLGKVAVAAVVVNRVLDPGFPNTVRGVIYQTRQFTPVITGKIDNVRPSKESISAVRTALKGIDPTRGSVYFYNPAISDPLLATWHENRTPMVVIGQHVFSR